MRASATQSQPSTALATHKPPLGTKAHCQLMPSLVPLALKDLTLLSSKGGKDSFVLSNKVTQIDGHSRAALYHHGPG